MCISKNQINRFITFLLVVFAAPLAASEIDMRIPDGAQVVAAPQVKEMMKSGEYLLVNSLSEIEFGIQHIPGSVNIPVDKTISSDTKHPLLPEDKSSQIIFYCMGSICPYSRIATREAIKAGYTSVFWFRGGIMQWRKYQYPMVEDRSIINIKVPKLSPDEFIEIRENQNAFVIDVRPKWYNKEIKALFAPGYPEGTNASIPLIELKDRMDELPKGRPILVSDGKMLQSINASKYLISNGFNVIGVLKGGIARWDTEGKPTSDTLQL